MLAIGCDHGGFELKQSVMAHLKARGIEYMDLGCYENARCHYPDYAQKVAEAILSKEADLGILICGTGAGISIAANKIPGIRCGLCTDTFTARHIRLHNDANILAFGGRVVGPGLANDLVDAFLGASFEGGRHADRVEMIREIERKYTKEK